MLWRTRTATYVRTLTHKNAHGHIHMGRSIAEISWLKNLRDNVISSTAWTGTQLTLCLRRNDVNATSVTAKRDPFCLKEFQRQLSYEMWSQPWMTVKNSNPQLQVTNTSNMLEVYYLHDLLWSTFRTMEHVGTAGSLCSLCKCSPRHCPFRYS